MQRTQIYLTLERQQRIAARARDGDISKAEAIRRILDRELGLDHGTADRLAAIESTAGLLPSAPEWQERLEGGMRSAERSGVTRLFAAISLVPVTDGIAARTAEHLRRYRRSHAAIDIVDYVIAATTEQTDARLLTLNVRHFPMIRGLKPAFCSTHTDRAELLSSARGRSAASTHPGA